MDQPSPFFASLCWVQGLYYLLTGLWPLVSVRSFQWVTGPKTDNWTGREGDHWLLNTVAALIVATALPLLTAAIRGVATAEITILACGAIVGLTLIDVVYVARRVIPPIYLLDGVLEVALLIAWGAFLFSIFSRS